MTAQTRKETARAFAEAMGWTFYGDRYPADADRYFTRADGRYVTNLPAPDAPLHEHLAFVGRVAEALGTGVQMGYCPKARAAWVGFDERVRSQEAPDPSWAAMLAAIAVKRC